MTNYAINYGGKLLSGEIPTGAERDDYGDIVVGDQDYGDATREGLLEHVGCALAAIELLDREEDKASGRAKAGAAALQENWYDGGDGTDPERWIRRAKAVIEAVDAYDEQNA